MTFEDLNLIPPILQALKTEGYEIPTPIQQKAIPHLLEGRDLLGCAQTGTGKTAAFAIPILQLLESKRHNEKGTKRIKTLILTPTRELAIQIDESFAAYGRNLNLKHLVVFGGVGQKPQTDALSRGVDILVATPGRLLDLINQRFISLSDISIFVLDEADRMLDMGFIHDVKKVIKLLPPRRQTLFFSATMPPEISGLADSILSNPVKVEVTPVSSTAEKVEQGIYFVDKGDKKSLLVHILQDESIKSVLVFARTKHGSNKLVKELVKEGIRSEAIHGNKSQSARQAALSAFKARKIRVLVATDIAARGIDVEELTHVINYELPNIPETYVHRIGRTGRAGASGIALSFCESEEREYLQDIQKLIGKILPVVEDHPYVSADNAPVGMSKVPGQQQKPKPQQQQQQRGGGDRNRQQNQQRQPQNQQVQKPAQQQSQPQQRSAQPQRPPQQQVNRQENQRQRTPQAQALPNRSNTPNAQRPPQEQRSNGGRNLSRLEEMELKARADFSKQSNRPHVEPVVDTKLDEFEMTSFNPQKLQKVKFKMGRTRPFDQQPAERSKTAQELLDKPRMKDGTVIEVAPVVAQKQTPKQLLNEVKEKQNRPQPKPFVAKKEAETGGRNDRRNKTPWSGNNKNR